MDHDYGKDSREALTCANEMAERALLWGLVFAAIVVLIAILKGVFG